MPSRLQGIFALLLASFIWGAGVPFYKELRVNFSREWILFIRFGLAALMFAPFLWRARLADLGAGIILGGILFLCFVLQIEAGTLTSPGRGAFFLGFTLLAVPAFSMLSGRPPDRQLALAILVAALGHSVLCWEGGVANIGDLLSFANGLLYGVFVVLLERATHQGASPVRMIAMMLLTIAVCAGAWVLPGEAYSAHGTLEDLRAHAPAALVIALAAGVVFTLLAWGQARISADEAAIVYAFDPVAPVLVAGLLTGAAMAPREQLAALLLGAGLLISQWRRGPAPAPLAVAR